MRPAETAAQRGRVPTIRELPLVRFIRWCPVAVAALYVLAGCGPRHETDRDWSPDSIPDAYRKSVAALMWPGATRSFQVTPEGDFFNGAWLVRVSAHAGADTAVVPAVVAYRDRWCPVVRWTRWSGRVRWDFEAVAAPAPQSWLASARLSVVRLAARKFQEDDQAHERAALHGRSESRLDSLLLRARRPLDRDPVDRTNLLVSLQIRVTNTGRSTQHVGWELTCEPPPDPAPFGEPDSLIGIPWRTCWTSTSGRDSVLGWTTGRVDGPRTSEERDLAPGGRDSVHVILSAYPAVRSNVRDWARESHSAYVDQVGSYWLRETGRGTRFAVPDPEVVSAIRAAEVILLSARERRTTNWVPLGGPFHYRDVWLRDGARAMHALAIAGYTNEARQLATSFLDFQWPHGPFMSQTGQLDGTGQALWAFEQVMLRPTPAPSVRRFAASALLAWRSLERQRNLTTGSEPGSYARMLPATDPHDAELIEAQLVGNDAWAIAGYRAAARLSRAAGKTAQADSIETSEAAYVSDFRQALERTARTDIPPSWQGGGTDWGNLAVGYPCMTLPATDPHLDALAHRYWAPLGGAGPGYYRDPDSLHSYVAVDLGTWALLADERSMADSVLDAALAWRSASGGAAEVFTRSGRDFGRNFPPHATAAAALITLIRNSLIFDDTDTLQLTLGAREAWWKGASVERAPTRWGTVNLSFRRAGNVAEWRWTAVPVWTALTLPPHHRVDGPLSGGLRPGSRPNMVLAPPGTAWASVRIAPVAE